MKWIYSKGRGFRLEMSDRMIVWVAGLMIVAVKGDGAYPLIYALARYLVPGAFR